MRASLFVAALLGSTFLTPAPGQAAPVVAFVAGSLGVASGAAIAATAAYAAGATFAGTLVGGFIVKAVVAVGLSALAGALAPKPTLPPPGARMVNFAQPVAYAEHVYGRVRKGGPVGFTGFADSRRYYVPILAAHEINGIVEHWLDERIVTLADEGDVTKSNVETSPISGFGRIDAFLGAAGQTAHTGLVDKFPEFTVAHDFKGLSGAVVWAARPPQEKFTKVYPSGRQWAYAPVLDGKNDIYDPRDGSTGFTANAALVLADWIVNILDRQVDWGEVAEEADACDVLVANAGAEMQPRWVLNGTISDDMTFEDQRAQMAAACDGFVYERTDGKVGFSVGRWVAPTLTLTADDFFALELSEGQWGADAPDEVSATYVEPLNAWRETPSGIWVENASSVPVRDEPQLYMVSNHNQAARLCKRIARMKRSKYQIRGTIGMAGYEILGGRDGGRAHRFIRIANDELGIDEYFEIGELARESVGTFTLTANSVAATDFDFDAAVEEPDRPTYGTVTNDGSIPVPGNLAGGAMENGSLVFSWDEQLEGYVQEIRYRTVGDTTWLSQVSSSSADRMFISGFGDGVDIEAQIRNRTYGAGAGDWGPETPIEVSTALNLTPPVALTSFTATAASGDAQVDFSAPNDQNYFGTRIYRGTSTNFAAATLIHTEYGIPSDSDSYTDQAPGTGTFHYWAEPINGSNKTGPLSGPETVVL